MHYLIILKVPQKILLLRSEIKRPLITASEWLTQIPGIAHMFSQAIMLGRVNKIPCFALMLGTNESAWINPDIVKEFDLRQWQRSGESTIAFGLAARALHISSWQFHTKHCERCGAQLLNSAHECAKICPACSHTLYPRINPAIIVGIWKEKHILLVRTHISNASWWSLVAGYVEAGERLEDAVHREAQEETGIHLKEPQYHSSQAWPYSQSLMNGFIAEWKHGDITKDRTEIADAQWFDVNDLPEIPPPLSISWQIIQTLKQSLQ